MRITQIMLGEGFGGAERSFVDTSLALAARGHQVQAICHRNFIKKDLLQGVDNIRLDLVKVGGELVFISPIRIALLLKDFKAEVIHTQLKRAAWHGGRAAKLAGVPIAAKLHNYVSLRKYCHIHTLIGTTDDQRRYAIEQGWPPDRISVIPNFSRVKPVEGAHVSGSSPLQILAYGRYVHKKGFDVLLRAFKTLLDAGVDAVLTIGGDGPEREVLGRLAQELGVDARVNLGVWIDDVSAALDQTDIFVLPSRDEPFGIVMLEAMARGVPVVTTCTQGPKEVLSDETACFVEINSSTSLAKTMIEMAGNPLEARNRAERALELYRTTYYEDAVLPCIEALYQGMISH